MLAPNPPCFFNNGIADLVTKVGDHVIAGLRSIAKDSGVFTSVRGKGSLIAFTVPSPDLRVAMLSSLMNAGVIALPCGKRSVRFRLPLIMTLEDANELLTRTKMAVGSLATA